MTIFGFNPLFGERISPFRSSVRFTETDDGDIVVTSCNYFKVDGLNSAGVNIVVRKNQVISHLIKAIDNRPIPRCPHFRGKSTYINWRDIAGKNLNGR